MSVVIQKGENFTGSYTATSIGDATDWAGTVSLHRESTTNPAVASKPLVYDGPNAKMLFEFTAIDVTALDSGVYAVVGHVESAALGVSIDNVTYATVLPVVVLPAVPMTTITMTIAKIDGTPAGKETHTLTNTVDGAVVTLGWDGVQVTASHPVADEISGAIIGTETISTKTNAAGYAQLAVIKGSTVTVSCPAFGKTVEVNTTGLDTIDLSTHF